MPSGVYKRKKGIRKGIRFNTGKTHFKKGDIPWNKNKEMSNEFKEKCKKNRIGKKLTEEVKTKISKSMKGHKGYWKERKRPFKTRKKMSEAHKGKKSYLWKGGITDENNKIRRNIEFRLWREVVFARDNWSCQKCKIRGGKLHPHHIQNFSQFPELRFAIDNGITLCRNCHKEFHKIYNKKDNSKGQIEKFLLVEADLKR